MKLSSRALLMVLAIGALAASTPDRKPGPAKDGILLPNGWTITPFGDSVEMNDLIPHCSTTGRLMFDGEDIYQPRIDVVALRRRIGMVFQKPNPFPKSIYENVAYGLRVRGVRSSSLIAEKVEQALQQFVLLQTDVTRNTEDDSALLKHFGLFGPPGIIFFGRDGREMDYRVVGYQQPEKFLGVLHAVNR